jgi:Galactose oxidase, central domain
LLGNGKVLIAGGQDEAGTVLSSAELYDPITGTFVLTGNMQLPRAAHTATLLSNGKVLLLGSKTETNTAELFDPASGIFSATGSLIQARAHHTATLLPDGNVLVLGGTHIAAPDGGGAPSAAVSLDSAEIYDRASSTFRTAGKLLVARDSHTATLLPNGTVLVAGGYSHGFDGDADPEWVTMFTSELFELSASVSSSAASLEGDRAGQSATLLNSGQVLVTGGTSGFQQLCCSPNPYSVKLASAELYK